MESNPTTPNSNGHSLCIVCTTGQKVAEHRKEYQSLSKKKYSYKNYFDSATLASSLRNLNGIDSCTNEADFA